jgi:FixJ family two-component response regulator
MNSATVPPRFVPTLTDVVHSVDHFSPQAQPFNHDVQQNPVQLEDQIVHRVMQRVDLVLERRLREAVAQVILSHTQTLGPRLREEIELVVRESVSQAVAQELPQRNQEG